MQVEAHHHEVATGGQMEIDVRFDSLTRAADHLIMYKYIVKNTATKRGRTVTFMPKPLFGDNGSGMHCHQSLWKAGKNLFAGDGYGGFSQMGLHYIGEKPPYPRSEEHTSELQSLTNLVCRLL